MVKMLQNWPNELKSWEIPPMAPNSNDAALKQD